MGPFEIFYPLPVSFSDINSVDMTGYTVARYVFCVSEVHVLMDKVPDPHAGYQGLYPHRNKRVRLLKLRV